MRTREIPAAEWAAFLAVLSGRTGDLPVDVRVEGPEIGDQELAHGAHLVGIACEEKGSAAEAIALTVERSPGVDALTHVIAAPTHVWVQEDDQGRVAVLDIEDRAQVKTLVFFPAPAPAAAPGP